MRARLRVLHLHWHRHVVSRSYHTITTEQSFDFHSHIRPASPDVSMSRSEVQALLRFLSQDAKLPLATAMAKVKDLQQADLDSPEKLSKIKAKDLAALFPEEKTAKQVVAAARRVAKKRAAGDENDGSGVSPQKKRKLAPSSESDAKPGALEDAVALPECTASETELLETVLVTNRAPLVLAFAVTLLSYSMPEQPVSSRLSLAQGYVSTTSRARAVALGIQEVSREEAAQEAGLGEGQPVVKVMGKEIRVLRRWGYEWKEEARGGSSEQVEQGVGDGADASQTENMEEQTETESSPALWALDLEALRKSNSAAPVPGASNMPIYTPQSARAYLLKSFESVAPAADGAEKKASFKARAAEKEANLGRLLKALDLVYASWATTMSPEQLDQRTWSWYVKVRPAVENGVAGWGGKNEVRLADVLALRRET